MQFEQSPMVQTTDAPSGYHVRVLAAIIPHIVLQCPEIVRDDPYVSCNVKLLSLNIYLFC